MRYITRRALPFALLLLVGLLGTTPSAWAAAGRITGTVTDAATGESLPGANVRIAGTSLGAATNLDGEYVISAAPAGPQTLIVTYVGYEPEEREVVVEDGGTIEVNFELSWQGIRGEEVVVTAQAEGQTAAINQQLTSNTIANVVSGARIQELPDVNAAESVGRLPGISIQRSGGEANKIAIRGLSPKYNTVTVNGVRVPATGGADRSVDLSLISSNMLDGIEVRKAITPDMDADAIGGSVNLKLKDAPEGLQVNLTAQGGYNRLQDYYGNYKFAGSVSNRFLESRLGVIASFNVDNFDRSADKLSADYRLSENAQTGEDEILVSNVNLREENIDRSRAGGSLVLDYEIPAGNITANTFYQRLENDGLYRIRNMSVGGNPRQYYNLERRTGTTSIFTGAIGIEQDFNWIRYDASVSRTASNTENPEDYTWEFADEGGILETLVTSEMRPQDIPGVVNIDSLTGLKSIFVWETDRNENVTTAQLNLQAPFRLSNSITGYVKVGGKLRWLDRMNDQQQTGRDGIQYGSGAGNLNEPLECIALQLPDWNLDTIVGTEGLLPIADVLANYTRDNFLEGDYELAFVPREDSLMQLTRALQSCTAEATDGEYDQYRNYAIGSRGEDYEGIERYQAGYVMAEFKLGQDITLIPGVRWENDYSRYEGQRYREVVTAWEAQAPADLDTLTNVRENSFWLPMVHLKYEPTEWLDLRLARTETLTRPDYPQYAPITTIDAFRSTVNAANALLRPAHSTNYDAAISVYQSKVGLFTVAGFYKSIEDLIVPVQYRLQTGVPLIEGTNVPPTWYDGAPTMYTEVNNPFEATYRGVEFDLQTNFWYLPSFLRGLVLSANYTYIESETTYQGFTVVKGDSLIRERPPVYNNVLKDTTRTGRMLDQPSHIANVTVGYDVGGFSTRLSFLYQTDVSTYIHSFNPLFDNFSGDYFRVDLAASQKLGRGLQIFANFNNLNARPDENFRASASANPTYLEYYGFTMDLGARFRY